MCACMCVCVCVSKVLSALGEVLGCEWPSEGRNGEVSRPMRGGIAPVGYGICWVTTPGVGS